MKKYTVALCIQGYAVIEAESEDAVARIAQEVFSHPSFMMEVPGKLKELTISTAVADLVKTEEIEPAPEPPAPRWPKMWLGGRT